MSPVVKQKKEKFTRPGKYLLLFFSIICIVLMIITYGTSIFDKPFNAAVGYVIVPFERGIGKFGEWLANRSEEFSDIKSLLAENSELKAQIAKLTEENAILSQDRYELNSLRTLFELNNQYDSYSKVGARIISKDSGNWFSSFVIDKGTNEGLSEGMNVIAGGGLVGCISSIGPNWSRVTAVISDGNHVSCQVLSTGKTLIVSGDLELMNSDIISFSMLQDEENIVTVGDKVVTSRISDKYLPGILVGYIQFIETDNNNLTKSGYITPAVDFENLSEVLVITDMKNNDF